LEPDQLGKKWPFWNSFVAATSNRRCEGISMDQQTDEKRLDEAKPELQDEELDEVSGGGTGSARDHGGRRAQPECLQTHGPTPT
jgi:hypothetical protein